MLHQLTEPQAEFAHWLALLSETGRSSIVDSSYGFDTGIMVAGNRCFGKGPVSTEIYATIRVQSRCEEHGPDCQHQYVDRVDVHAHWEDNSFRYGRIGHRGTKQIRSLAKLKQRVNDLVDPPKPKPPIKKAAKKARRR